MFGSGGFWLEVLWGFLCLYFELYSVIVKFFNCIFNDIDDVSGLNSYR